LPFYFLVAQYTQAIGAGQDAQGAMVGCAIIEMKPQCEHLF
jgi:hypothetical protein